MTAPGSTVEFRAGRHETEYLNQTARRRGETTPWPFQPLWISGVTRRDHVTGEWYVAVESAGKSESTTGEPDEYGHPERTGEDETIVIYGRELGEPRIVTRGDGSRIWVSSVVPFDDDTGTRVEIRAAGANAQYLIDAHGTGLGDGAPLWVWGTQRTDRRTGTPYVAVKAVGDESSDEWKPDLTGPTTDAPGMREYLAHPLRLPTEKPRPLARKRRRSSPRHATHSPWKPQPPDEHGRGRGRLHGRAA